MNTTNTVHMDDAFSTHPAAKASRTFNVAEAHVLANALQMAEREYTNRGNPQAAQAVRALYEGWQPGGVLYLDEFDSPA